MPLLMVVSVSAMAQELPSPDSAANAATYRLSGARELRPQEIGDDGVRAYLRWSPEQELPAVFALNSRGQEEMVDGYMRQGVFTIDRINTRLVFRIDKRVARADRRAKRI